MKRSISPPPHDAQGGDKEQRGASSGTMKIVLIKTGVTLKLSSKAH
jgi:hypothetical protein